jgi:hypothetical protein
VCVSRFLLVLLLQKLRMVKDFWLDGVQVKIWKGYVEGGSVYVYLCVCSLLQNCAAYLWPPALLLLLLQCWGAGVRSGGVTCAALAEAILCAASASQPHLLCVLHVLHHTTLPILHCLLLLYWYTAAVQIWQRRSWSPATATSGRAKSTQTSGPTASGEQGG